MSLLLVEQSGRRTPITLNGKLVIGRGTACKLRIDHPLVSRDHAVIEHSDRGYTLRDTGSRNGTKVNNSLVKTPILLQDGDRIDIGPTTMWFRSSEQDPHIETLPTNNAEEGVVFECECTARLWAPMTLAGATVRCRHCNRDVTCPTIFTPVEPGKVTELSDCAICLSKVTTADEQHVCESCGAVYHDECWTDNCGCAAYGCKQVNVLSSDRAVTGTADPIDEEDFELDDLQGAPPARPWDAALLGAAAVGTILGLISFGATALLVALFSGWYLLRRRTAWVAGALLLSLVGFAAGLVVSGLWWLNISPVEWFTK